MDILKATLVTKKSSLFVIIILAITIFYWFFVYNSVTRIEVESMHVGCNNVQELEQSADLIVIAEPTCDFEERKHVITNYNFGDIQDFYTLTEIKIMKILKQPTDFDSRIKTMDILEPNSMLQTLAGKQIFEDNGYQELKKGSKYIIFLGKNDKGKYLIINLNLGKFNIDNTDNTDENKEKIKFKQDVLNKFAIN